MLNTEELVRCACAAVYRIIGDASSGAKKF